MAENLVYKVADSESSLNAATADSVIVKADAKAVIEKEQDINVAKAEAIGIATVLGATDKIDAIKAAAAVSEVVEKLDAIETGWSTIGKIQPTEAEGQRPEEEVTPSERH